MNSKLFSLPGLAATLAFAVSASAVVKVQNQPLGGINKIDFYTAKSNINLVGSDRADLELTLEKPFTSEKSQSPIELSSKVDLLASHRKQRRTR